MGSKNDRVFDVSGTGVSVTMRGLRISGGSISTDGGGGIKVGAGATLTLSASTVSGNSAKEGRRAQLRDGDGRSEHMSGNTSAGKGGGLFNAGTATVRNSTVSGNSPEVVAASPTAARC